VTPDETPETGVNAQVKPRVPGPRFASPDPPRPPPLSPRRALTAAVLGCVAGAGAALYAASRTWQVLLTPRPAPQPALVEHLTGSALLPLLPALGLVALAGAGGIVAAKGVARTGVGALLAAAGLGIVFIERGVLGRDGLALGWVVVATAGGILVATAGALTLRNGRRWPVMGARYDRAGSAGPTGAESTPDGAVAADGRPAGAGQVVDAGDGSVHIEDTAWWDAIDRGEDPTKA
jgi:hypothetical protein